MSKMEIDQKVLHEFTCKVVLHVGHPSAVLSSQADV